MSFISNFFLSIKYLFLILFPFVTISLFLFVLSIISSQNNIFSALSIFLVLSSINIIIFIFLLFLVFLISFFLPALYRYTRIVSYILVSLLFFSLVTQQIAAIKTLSYFIDIKNRWIPCQETEKIINKISCLIIGYMPTENTSIIESIIFIYGFYLYAIIIPLFIFYKLIKDFIDNGGVIQNETSRKIISIAMTLLVYRAFIITKLIDFLYIGYIGIGLLVLNLLSIRYVIKKINILYDKISATTRGINKRKVEEISDVVKKELARLKLIPSVGMISIFFEDNIRNNLKTIFEIKNKMDIYENLVMDFEKAVMRRNRNEVISCIDRMINSIDREA